MVGPTTEKTTRPTNKLPRPLIDEVYMVEKEVFDPKNQEFFSPSGISSIKMFAGDICYIVY